MIERRRCCSVAGHRAPQCRLAVRMQVLWSITETRAHRMIVPICCCLGNAGMPECRPKHAIFRTRPD
ncbi:hypothetical protein FPL06_11455 [Xanthomonas citri pv. glycines]|nr:hypothetical protein F7R02_09135 [Xanthomonas cissicola]QDR45741.1 hypothetical protein FPK90_14535 [Xanthomonas citri pv. glycines]QDS07736.1 hypothetical protein FPL00_13460 [Xanthomonas citri pv. glycines]QDS12075.1 hypothetical protein FPL03_13715 [Xanthomonas citri pv. glycines]QDS20682.1 hypothetical protein FPL05_13865 [Xanthomonas citri pv. glycines]